MTPSRTKDVNRAAPASWRRRAVALTLWMLCGPAFAAAQIFFSFRAADGGGLGRIEVDAQTGDFIAQEAVYSAATARAAFKVAQSPEGYAALTVNERGPENFVFRAPDGRVRTLSLPDKLDEVRLHGRRALVGGEEGGVYLVRLDTGELERSWKLAEALHPPGRRPEDLRIEREGRRAWVTLQKDSKKGDREGQRVVYLDLDSGAALADLRLPRDRADLHYGRDGDFRQRGPGPEIVMPFESAGVLLVTLDLYGAIGFADLTEARQGRLTNWTVLPTAPDGSWGAAFPDRVAAFAAGGREFALVLNAGAAGGAAVADVAKRNIVQRLAAGHGLSTPAFVPAARAVVAASGGKLKRRGAEDVEKTFHPRAEIAVFDLTEEGGPLALRVAPTGDPAHALRPVAPESSALILVNVGESADAWLVMDIRDGRILGRRPALGRVERLAP